MRTPNRAFGVFAATALAASLLLQPSADAQAISPNQPFSGLGREGASIDVNALTNPETYQNPALPAVPLPGNLVVFGDSVMANMRAADTAFSAATRGLREKDPKNANIISQVNPAIDAHGCAHGTPSVPKRMAEELGMPLSDYSCPGAAMYSPGMAKTIVQQVDAAVSDHALNPTTRKVVIQGGFNDIYNNYLRLTGEERNDAAIARRIGQETQRDLFNRAIDAIVTKVKQAAPNAQITLLDYHEITENTPAGWQCIYHIGDGRGAENKWNANVAFPVFWDTRGEMLLQKWMSEAAARHQVKFLDLREMSKGHGECAEPKDRWVAGIVVDTTTGDFNTGLHLTDNGVHAVGTYIAQNIR